MPSNTPSWGRGITCVAISSPTPRHATAPASTAARTLPTSPRTTAVTKPPPISIIFTNSTDAALHIASLASISPTRPFVSIIPSACLLAMSLLNQFEVLRQVQSARVRFIGVHVDVQARRGIDAHDHALEGHSRGSAHAQLHHIALAHSVIRRFGRV